MEPSLVCNYCKRRGHVLSECWALEKKKANNPVMTVIREKQPLPAKHRSQLKDQVKPGMSLEEEHPFVSEGFVSLTEEDEKIPIKILRDIGASQSLMIQSMLPLSDQTSMATYTRSGAEYCYCAIT